MTRRRWRWVAGLLVAAGLVLGACGSSDNGGVIEGTTVPTSQPSRGAY